MLEKTQNADGTVGKALYLVEIVESFGKPVRFNDILRKSPYPKPSTYRLLQTMVRQELLSYNGDSGYYTLGTRLIRLAHSAWRHASLAPIAAPFIDVLSAKTGETIHLAKLDHGQVLYLDKRNARKPISMFSDAGKIGPAYCTGVGKAMLAFLDHDSRDRVIAQQSFFAHTPNTHRTAQSLRSDLDDIFKQGVSFDREEHEINIICIAVPIKTSGGHVIGGMSITNSTTRTTLGEIEKFKEDLQNTAQQIGESASMWMFPQTGGL